MTKRFAAVSLAIVLPLVLFTAGAVPPSDKIAPEVRGALDAAAPSQNLTVIVHLWDQADLTPFRALDRAARLTGIVRALQAKADATQRRLRGSLQAREAQGLVTSYTPFWVFNGLAVTATPDVILELAAQPEVEAITPDEIDVVPAGSPGPNLSLIGAPDVWNLGLQGQGVVVASLDSGVDVTHPDLAVRWRGGSNSWFDPYGQHTVTPTDLSGHGTWTMGVMVGGDAGGTSIGVAPQAQWIAVKIFNDAGSATASAIHQGFQWLLDPDGNPNTADAPNVVNNSWSYGAPGCNLEFQPDLQALRAADILPVFAAGNYGPWSQTSVSPANYPEAFAVGATRNDDRIYGYSGRGPSACGENSTVYPELVAPGVGIYTTDLFGLYATETGTSAAAPHVAGALALLLQAFPELTADQQVAALTISAVDLGASGPDNSFGYGRLDILAAYDWLTANGDVTPPPPDTAAPSVAINAPGDGDTLVGTAVVDVTASDDVGVAKVDLYVDGVYFANDTASAYSFALDTTALVDGVHTLQAMASDAAGNTASTALISVAVANNVNHAPVAVGDAFSAPYWRKGKYTARVFALLTNDSDADGNLDPASVTIVRAPDQGGTAKVNSNGTVSYTPKKGFKGVETFDYTVDDTLGATSNSATVRVTVQ
jgi:subtilisin family serine protease